jgi:hypothetical protein
MARSPKRKDFLEKFKVLGSNRHGGCYLIPEIQRGFLPISPWLVASDSHQACGRRQRKMPPPRVISDLIVKALKAKRPKTRYHGGMLAGPMLFLRQHLSDRMFDRVIMLALR